ncbi:MAG: hypothetical protein FWF29_07795 [Treponema sp.]|nr:hypothetical protein [Treponema sp.]
MENVFMKGKDHGVFSWENLCNIKEGCGSLGEEMPVNPIWFVRSIAGPMVTESAASCVP